MSFLGSLIVVGPVRPSILTGIFAYQSHCFCVFLFLFLSLVSEAVWWIIDKPPMF